MNDVGTNKYDNAGMAEGMLLTANDVGTNKYDNAGMAEGFPGTSTPTGGGSVKMIMGIGF